MMKCNLGRGQCLQPASSGCSSAESSEAYVIQGLVVNAEGLGGFLHQLVRGEVGVVRHGSSVRNLINKVNLTTIEAALNSNLWRRDHGVRVHNPVRILFHDLRDEEGPHAGASNQGVSQLEPLQQVTALGLLPHKVQHTVH